jgi:hypothetical protein
MSLGKILEQAAKHAPPGYIHVSEYADRHKLERQRMSAIASYHPSTVRVGNYLFVPETLKIERTPMLNYLGELVDRYSVVKDGTIAAAPGCRKCPNPADVGYELCASCERDYQNDG